MEIVVHSHNADVSDRLRQRAERALRKLSERLTRTVNGTVRFEADGQLRRVELSLQAPRRKLIVAHGEARNYGPALAQAVARVESQLRRRKRATAPKGGRNNR